MTADGVDSRAIRGTSSHTNIAAVLCGPAPTKGKARCFVIFGSSILKTGCSCARAARSFRHEGAVVADLCHGRCGRCCGGRGRRQLVVAVAIHGNRIAGIVAPNVGPSRAVRHCGASRCCARFAALRKRRATRRHTPTTGPAAPISMFLLCVPDALVTCAVQVYFLVWFFKPLMTSMRITVDHPDELYFETPDKGPGYVGWTTNAAPAAAAALTAHLTVDVHHTVPRSCSRAFRRRQASRSL